MLGGFDESYKPMKVSRNKWVKTFSSPSQIYRFQLSFYSARVAPLSGIILLSLENEGLLTTLRVDFPKL